MKKHRTLILLIIIYLAFIALGLPDALLGSSWNLVREDLNTSLSSLGLMTLVIYIFSVFSTFNAPKVLKVVQTKLITFVSILLTGSALILMSRVTEYYQMLFFAVPLGLGAGAIDVSLNHYLASHYKASHMNYLHSFYGVGVTLGPLIMAYTLKDELWRKGFVIVGLILLVIAFLVFFSFFLWQEETTAEREESHTHINLKEIFKTKGFILSVLIFMFYVHVETLGGVWIASYFFIEKEVSYAVAALFTTTFYGMFTLGRFLSGVLSNKIKPNTLIISGQVLMIIAAIVFFFKFDNVYIYFIIIGLYGLGCAPVFPNMMFMNSKNFPKRKLSKIISMQMTMSYIAFGVLTPLAGLVFERISISIYPFYVFTIAVIVLIITLSYMRKVSKV